MIAFKGNIEALQSIVNDVGLVGYWKRTEQGYAFEYLYGFKLMWDCTSKLITFDGALEDDIKEKLTTLLTNHAASAVACAVDPENKQAIFIVHGHDKNALEQLEMLLIKLKLHPYILQDSDSGGKTIIELIEQQLDYKTAFGIVLMTPDDLGCLKTDKGQNLKARARQNVIFEMGMLIAKLGRPNVAILQKGVVERPSDIEGVLRLEFNDHVREIALKLAQRLQGAGFKIDPNALLNRAL